MLGPSNTPDFVNMKIECDNNEKINIIVKLIPIIKV